jgi:hypothetical protein
VIRIHRIEQRTQEWFALRAGKLTASVADALYAKLKSGGEPAARRDLRIALAIESITGQPIDTDGFVSKDMQRGIDLEPEGCAAVEAATGELLEHVGFVERLDRPAGFSPDGLVLDGERIRGVLQLKCPKSATHIGYIRDGILPADYRPQVLHELWASGAEFHEFVSYDPRLPEGLRLFRVRTLASSVAAELDRHEGLVDQFLAEVAREAGALRQLRAAA